MMTNRALGLARMAAALGSQCCQYMPGAGNMEEWKTSRCDCKYGATGIGEQTGCPEARALYDLFMKDA